MQHKYVFGFFLCAIAFCCPFLSAQVIRLEGQVLDAQTQQSLPFVHVIVNEGEAGTVTDIDGRFVLNVGVAIQSVHFTYVGYTPFVYEVRQPEDLRPLQRF
ncbi:MAG: carboxypeptidase-like regulatory domain-containing protein [Microscillaceae bacterium]|nr:carboxypeptidase-like regulatory domain-containing protein [Microscillaceae bacterium]